jgi:large subunit ribosomal protein L3
MLVLRPVFLFSSHIDMKFILGKKLGMTTLHDENGAHNVTLVECEAKVALLKNTEKDGYSAVQLEIPKTAKKVKKIEFRLKDEKSELKVGDKIEVSIFAVGDIVKVSGTTKAKGFQGGVKRHGFKGSPKSHGHKHDLRAPGSIGAGFPEHVIKGKRMAGRMGGGRATSENIEVILVDKEKNLLGVEGAVPGNPGGIVEIRSVK